MLASQLLATKFQAPPLRVAYIRRATLVEKLETGRQAGARLALICAPAGYGKTSLAVEWLGEQERVCWVGLDAADNDPSRFFTCLVTALQSIEPALGMSTLSLLHVSPPAPMENVISELINETSSVEQPFVLALEDYHVIQNTEIHDALEALLARQPPALHIVITSREDPAFPLGRLRAQGVLTEIRVRDLRFTEEEAGAFLTAVHHLSLPDSLLKRLHEITEGWAAGLQLTGLAFPEEDDAIEFLENFRGTHQYVIDYLVEEVLKRQPPEIRAFLAQTSILDRFNADLAAALMEPGVDTRGILQQLERANLFLVPLDSGRNWYRYHRLFADVLHSYLEPGREQEARRRAAEWFAAQGMPAEAIPHYIAAGETAKAARLVRSQSGELIRRGELHTLLGWMRALPVEEIHNDAWLLAVAALALMMTGDLARAGECLGQVERLKAAGLPVGPLLAVLSWLVMVRGMSDTLGDPAKEALTTLEPQDGLFRVLPLLSLGTKYAWEGNIGASTEAFREAYRLGEEIDHAFASLAALANLSFNLYEMGRMRQAMALCQEASAQYADRRGKPLPVVGGIDAPMAWFALEENHLAEAETHAREGRERCQKMFASGMMGGDAELVLAECAFRRGDADAAFAILEETRRFAIEHQITFLAYKMTAREAMLRLRQGDIRGGQVALERLEAQVQNRDIRTFGNLNELRAWVYGAVGKTGEALEIIERLEASCRREGWNGRLIGVLANKAAILLRAGRKQAAVEVLEEAVRLAAPEYYFHSVYIHGQEILEILPEVRSAAPEYVDALLAVLGAAEPASVATPTATPPPAQQGVDSLSEQEMRILRLVAAGLSNQEIAAELYISTGTAKWHVHNILEKLDASSRAQAAAKARAMGIL